MAVVALGACGGATSSGVAIRVGPSAVTTAAVEHWISVLAGGHPTGRQRAVQRPGALERLISSAWLVDGAVEAGVAVSEEEVKRHMAEQQHASYLGGKTEFEEFLKATGQTVADLELQTRAELASTRLRQRVLQAVPEVTEGQVAVYYAQHLRRFDVPERRELRITNRKSAAAGRQVRREVAAGRSFLTLSLPETIQLSRTLSAFKPKSELEVAIQEAGLHVLTGPVRRGVDYFDFEVVEAVPPTRRPLAQARSSIRQQLSDERHKLALASAVGRWRREWTAKTDCQPGYVVQKCRQYGGPKSAEAPLAFN